MKVSSYIWGAAARLRHHQAAVGCRPLASTPAQEGPAVVLVGLASGRQLRVGSGRCRETRWLSITIYCRLAANCILRIYQSLNI